MIEHQTRKRWIKLWTQETLYGSTKTELEPDERGVWFMLLCLAGDSPVLGSICVADGLAYTDKQLTFLLTISQELLQRTVAKLVKHSKIILHSNNVIEITNFMKYQDGFNRSEYMKNYMSEYRSKLRKTNRKINSKNVNVKRVYVKLAEQNRTEEDNSTTLFNKDNVTGNTEDIYKGKYGSNSFNNNLFPIVLKLTSFTNTEETKQRFYDVIKDYPNINHRLELGKFVDWHLDKKKELKRPFIALRNWFDKSIEYKNANEPKQLPKQVSILGKTMQQVKEEERKEAELNANRQITTE